MSSKVQAAKLDEKENGTSTNKKVQGKKRKMKIEFIKCCKENKPVSC